MTQLVKSIIDRWGHILRVLPAGIGPILLSP
jgi:hypothetical protein